MGGGRGLGARALMTFSLWNLISIVSVVYILPRDSACHHGHTSSELLNAHRCHYTLVHMTWFLSGLENSSAICQHQRMIYSLTASLCCTLLEVMPATVRVVNASFPVLQLKFMTLFAKFTLGRVAFGSGAWTLCCGLTWLVPYGKSHWVRKKLHFQLHPTYFMAGFKWAKQTEKDMATRGGAERHRGCIFTDRKWTMGGSQQKFSDVFCMCAWCWGTREGEPSLYRKPLISANENCRPY